LSSLLFIKCYIKSYCSYKYIVVALKYILNTMTSIYLDKLFYNYICSGKIFFLIGTTNLKCVRKCSEEKCNCLRVSTDGTVRIQTSYCTPCRCRKATWTESQHKLSINVAHARYNTVNSHDRVLAVPYEARHTISLVWMWGNVAPLIC
jgi:hypothetical protein